MVLAEQTIAKADIIQYIFTQLVSSEAEEFKVLLSKVSAPTLIIWGTEDRVIDVKNAQVFNALCPTLRCECMTESGTYLCWKCPHGQLRMSLSSSSRCCDITPGGNMAQLNTEFCSEFFKVFGHSGKVRSLPWQPVGLHLSCAPSWWRCLRHFSRRHYWFEACSFSINEMSLKTLNTRCEPDWISRIAFACLVDNSAPYSTCSTPDHGFHGNALYVAEFCQWWRGFPGRGGGASSQAANFIGYYGKSSSLLSGSRRLNGCIQRQQVGFGLQFPEWFE